MRLSIRAIGRDRNSPTSQLVDEFCKRAQGLGRSIGLSGPTLTIRDAPKGLKGAVLQNKEAELLFGDTETSEKIILLDERGKNLTSRQLAQFIQSERDDGCTALGFYIGGADGFSSDLDQRLSKYTVQRISFGKLTWPHLMVRAMLAEQIYRSMTLISGHPYHRE